MSSPGDIARTLVREQDRAGLGTILRGTDGAPYVSLVLTACDHAGQPVLLLSDLADHTKNSGEEARVSLLYDGTAGHADPLTGARVTLQGRIAKTDDARLRARFLARHPSASLYADFGDFNFYRVIVERAHMVAGFGRIHWIDASDYTLQLDPDNALSAREPDVVSHMNTDHNDAVALYANVLLGRAGAGWRMTGVDPEGADLRRGGEVARVPFDTVVADADGARAALVRLVKQARGARKRA